MNPQATSKKLDLTIMSSKILLNARERAIDLGHDFVGTEHVLLALSEGEGLASILLAHSGITPVKTRTELLRLGVYISDAEALASIGIDLKVIWDQIETDFGIDASSAPPSFTESVKTAVGYAEEEAAALGHTFVGTEHLLLGVLRLEESTAGQVLQGLGVNLQDLRTRTVSTVERIIDLRHLADEHPAWTRYVELGTWMETLAPDDLARARPVAMQLQDGFLQAWHGLLSRANEESDAVLVGDFGSALDVALGEAKTALRTTGLDPNG